MQLDLSGRHALVCGASQGIGRASAIELARLGADVTVLARSQDALESLAAELPRTHEQQRHGWLTADMGDTEGLRRAVASLVARQPAQILIGNSGGPPGGAIQSAEPGAFLDAFRQHLVASQVLQQALAPAMRDAGFGRIVNVISTSVREPIPNLGVSNTVRAAVAAWAKTLSGELAADGVTVNNVLPGFTRTGRLDRLIAARSHASGQAPAAIAEGMLAQVPAGRFGEAAEVASVIAFLCTPAAAYVNGVSIAVDGGRTRALA